MLNAGKAVCVEQISNFYLTEPVGFIDQEWFINGAVQVSTCLNPFDLLRMLKSIESKAGRKQSSVRFGPRVLDFDIIFFNDAIINTPELVVPHPRMHIREFVLRPLCDLSPGRTHPILQKNIYSLLQTIPKKGPQCIQINPAEREIISAVLQKSTHALQKETANEVFY